MPKKLGYRAWERQPVGRVGINYGHQRAEGLAFFAPLSGAHGTIDLVGAQLGARTGLEDYLPSQSGAVQHLFGSGNYADFPTIPPSIGITTPFTLAWTQEPRSPSGYGAVFAANFGTAGVDSGFTVYTGTAADVYSMSVGPRGGGSFQAHSWGTSAGVLTDQRLDRFVFTSTGGPNSSTAGDVKLWRNGELLTRNAGATFGGNTAAAFRIGALETGGDPFEGLIGDLRMWARVLSDAESEVESSIAGAWDLYAPQRIVVPQAALTVPVLSVPEGIVITSTGFTPRVTYTWA